MWRVALAWALAGVRAQPADLLSQEITALEEVISAAQSKVSLRSARVDLHSTPRFPRGPVFIDRTPYRMP